MNYTDINCHPAEAGKGPLARKMFGEAMDGCRSIKTPSRSVTISSRIIQFLGLLVASWCVHDIYSRDWAHYLWLCMCATLTEADLRPWRLPYSLFDPDPIPLVTLWGGPVLGVADSGDHRTHGARTQCGSSPISASWQTECILPQRGVRATDFWIHHNCLLTARIR